MKKEKAATALRVAAFLLLAKRMLPSSEGSGSIFIWESREFHR
jgi:hypothetical protein